MPATLQTASALLKEIYEPRLRTQLEDSHVALKRIEKSGEGVTAEVGGRYVTFAMRTRRNAGIGARNEMELLPTPGQQGYGNARIPLKYLYGGVQLSGQTMELANTNGQAFASALDGEMEGLKDDLAKDQNRQVYGDSTGTLATVSADGANTVTVTDAMYLQMGMMVDIIDGTTVNTTPVVKASNRQITLINVATGVVTYSGADVAAAAGDILVRTGSVNREWSGLEKMVQATGVYQNVDSATEPVWRAEVDSNAGTPRSLSEGLMINMADRIRANGGKTTVILANLGVRRAYFSLLSQQRQYVNTKDFGGGFNGLSFTTDAGEIPMISDIDAPKNRMYFLNEKEITLYREGDWSFMDRDGSKWQRVIGYDAYEARMYQYSEIGCHRRNSQGVVKDLIEG